MGRAAECDSVNTLQKLSGNRNGLAVLLAGALGLVALGALFYGKFVGAILAFLVCAALFRYKYKAIGFLATYITQIVVLVFYSVLGGWAMAYFGLALTGRLESASMEKAALCLDGIVKCRGAMGICALLGALAFLALTAMIVAQGIRKGIERCSKIFMPIIVGLLVLIIIRGLLMPDAIKGPCASFQCNTGMS